MNGRGPNGGPAPPFPLRPGQRQNETPRSADYPPAQYHGQYVSTPPNGYHQPPYHAPPYNPHFYRGYPMPYNPYQMPGPHQQYPGHSIALPPYPQPQQTPPISYPHHPPPPPPLHPAHHPSISTGAPPQRHLSPSAAPYPAPTRTPSLTTPPVPPQPHFRPSESRPTSPPSSPRKPFYPSLPWLSVPDKTFPPPYSSSSKQSHRPRSIFSQDEPSLILAPFEPSQIVSEADEKSLTLLNHAPSSADTVTPVTSQPPSEADSTHPTTPSSALPSASSQTPTLGNPPRSIVPALPLQQPSAHSRHSSLKETQATKNQTPTHTEKQASPVAVKGGSTEAEVTENALTADEDEASEKTSIEISAERPAKPPVPEPPKSWADLLRSNAPKGVQNPNVANTDEGWNPRDTNLNASLADCLHSFDVDSSYGKDQKLAFIEPRGLVNTGNLCYMNSVLQILMYCVPLYGFLNEISKRVAHKFQSDTPLLDSMIMLMQKFRVIDSASSVEQLRMRLKDNELEQYGESFTPDFVYDVIRRLPRFATMRRGHQQDAEEFLGFLLEGLHDECVRVMKGSSSSGMSPDLQTPVNGVSSPKDFSSKAGSEELNAGWMEVGPKQKAAVTRSSGAIATESPITKIFGGKLRSELRVPGLKNSVTLEPYQPLQLDIQSPQIRNITDALRGLTRSEVLHGEFNSPRGPGASATKQVFIETTPPVLILHLKRFQYDNAGGTQKIWKKVGYPLELEIPKEAFPAHKRGGLVAHGGLPKYRLMGVVYHHGRSASGGHYTVDVRRQEGREWIRLDDTVISRIRSEVAAEGGKEEDPKLLAAALEQHRHDTVSPDNIFEHAATKTKNAEGDEQGWKQVSGPSSGTSTSHKKSWSRVANGNTTPTNSTGLTSDDLSLKDNKVAYLLFYQKL